MAAALNMMPLADETERAIRAFDDLLRIERERDEQARRRLDLEDRHKRLGEERIRQLEKEAEANKQVLAAGKQAADQIGSTGRIIADILGGKFLTALQGIIKGVQSFTAGQLPATKAPVKALGAQGGTATSGGGGMAGLSAAAGVAGAAISAVATAAEAAYGTFMRLSSAALPQGVAALQSSFKYLTAVIGSAIAPQIVTLGTAVVFAADLVKDLMPKILAMFEDGGDGFTKMVTWIVKAVLAPLTLFEVGVKGLLYGLAKLVEQLLYAVGYALKKAQFKTQGGRVEALGEQVGGVATRIWKADTVTDLIGKELAKSLKGIKIGGIGLGDRWKNAESKFAGSMMASGQGQAAFEGAGDAYKRMQEFMASTTPIEQEILAVQMKTLDEAMKQTASLEDIKKKTQPTVGR